MGTISGISSVGISAMPGSRGQRPVTALVALAVTALLLAGCSSSRLGQFTNSLSEIGRGGGSGTAAPSLAELGRRYDQKPGDKQLSLAYARALRQNGQSGQAVAVLQRASIGNVGDREIAAAYGKALADIGRFEEANAVLAQAHTADRPDWRVLSAQGSIADQMGNHARAREFYEQALRIAPNEPSVLNNYGLSFLLTRNLAQAEDYLRRAAAQPEADPRVGANLALVQQLQGKSATPARPGMGNPAVPVPKVAPVSPPRASAPLALTPRPKEGRGT